ncbi:unnamed protein product [Peronospora destructor]|uniref:Uncharacterized protein n=1 Tax=Peronospora destructor TaxID=86335 RepID=A0AAV0VD29_9STRA|nr:unnamed protein product [Peronospora destructor]
MAVVVTRSKVEDAQRKVDMLASTAAEEQRVADSKKACYFEAHARALEVAIASEATDMGDFPSPGDADGKLNRLEYEHRAAVQPERTATTPTEMPTATAIWERSCSTIQRLLSSFVRRRRGFACECSDPSSGAVLIEAVPHVTPPSDVPPKCPQDPDLLDSHNLDVTTAESTFTFGNTMCIDDLGGGAVTAAVAKRWG